MKLSDTISVNNAEDERILDGVQQIERKNEMLCKEVERLRHGIAAIIEGDKGDERLETAEDALRLLEKLHE